MQVKKKRKRVSMKYFSVLVIIIGVVFLAYPFTKNAVVGYISTNVSKQAEIISTEEIEMMNITYEFDDITPISVKDVISVASEAANGSLPVSGRITVPSVGIDLAILEGVSNRNMSVGAGTLKAGQMMGAGNYVLASHHMRNRNLLFTPLDRVEVGERIYLHDGEETFEYIIIQKEVIEASKVDVIEDQEGKTLVTLITCDDDGKKRLMVVGELI